MRNFTKMLQLVLALALTSSFAFAQTTESSVADFDPNAPAIVTGAENTSVTVINESFESTTFPPSGWTKLSPDGGTGWNRQAVGTTPIPGWNGGTVVSPTGGGMGVAFCTWSTGGATYNDQWLVSPQLTGVIATDMLTFWVYKFSDLYADSLAVLVSTTGNAAGNFTNILADIHFADTDTGWFYKSYSLSAFAGQSIYIGFREHIDDNLNDGAALFLDLVHAGSGGGTGSQMWDLQLVLNADSISQGGTGLAGAEYDGTNFFAAEWGYLGGKTLFRISPAGTLVDSIIPTFVAGASGLRDLAWDGNYLYGSPANTSIYCFTSTGTLIATITSPVAVRAIAYDEVNDGFWVNNFSTDLTLVSRIGSILNVIPTPPSCYGMAYDNNSSGGPYLWLFTGVASGGTVCQVEQLKISTGTLTGISHTVSSDIGPGLAGGLFSAPNIVPGEYTLGGLIQSEEDIFCYYLDMVVGQEEINYSELEVTLFPNPATEQFRVNSPDRILSLEVMNNLGQLVYTAQVNSNDAVVNVSKFNKGVYFVRIQGENSAVIRKVTVE